jgi:RNA polymerase sigma-70 factor (sigma-E family)
MPWAGGPSRRDFDAFVATAGDGLVRSAYLMLGDLGDAEDAAQETFLRIAKRWYRVRVMEHPVAYARRILLNVIFDAARDRSRRRDELDERRAGSHVDERIDDAAERAMGRVDARLDVASALAALSLRQRAVVVLRYWAGLSEAEAAAALGCSIGTVKSTASRSLARLRQLMADSMDGTDAAPAGHLRADELLPEGDGLHATALDIRRRTR